MEPKRKSLGELELPDNIWPPFHCFLLDNRGLPDTDAPVLLLSILQNNGGVEDVLRLKVSWKSQFQARDGTIPNHTPASLLPQLLLALRRRRNSEAFRWTLKLQDVLQALQACGDGRNKRDVLTL